MSETNTVASDNTGTGTGQEKNKPVNVAGIWVYDHLPEGMRVGTVEDLIESGTPHFGRWFMIQSFFENNHYGSYQVREGFDLKKWLPWIEAGKMFVKKNQ